MDELDLLLEEVREQIKRREWKRANPYVADLIAVLRPYKDGLERQHVMSAIGKLRRNKGLPIPTKLEEVVQSAFQSHSCEYAAFQRRGASASDDLFYPVGSKGSGVWAVHIERATKWLAAKSRRQQ